MLAVGINGISLHTSAWMDRPSFICRSCFATALPSAASAMLLKRAHSGRNASVAGFHSKVSRPFITPLYHHTTKVVSYFYSSSESKERSPPGKGSNEKEVGCSYVRRWMLHCCKSWKVCTSRPWTTVRFACHRPCQHHCKSPWHSLG
jgi:hypothetical protein